MTTQTRPVQIVHVPDCPLVEQLRRLVTECMATTGTERDIEFVVGDYPSPTLVIDGTDVTTGQPVGDQVCCRLDMPTRDQIIDALSRSEVQ